MGKNVSVTLRLLTTLTLGIHATLTLGIHINFHLEPLIIILIHIVNGLNLGVSVVRIV